MEKVDAIKSDLKSPNVLSTISESVYKPRKEKINTIAENYSSNPNIVVYEYYLENNDYRKNKTYSKSYFLLYNKYILCLVFLIFFI